MSLNSKGNEFENNFHDNKSKEEILDFLMKPRNMFEEFSFYNLNQKFQNPFKRKLFNILKNILEYSNLKANSGILLSLLMILSLSLTFSQQKEASSKLYDQKFPACDLNYFNKGNNSVKDNFIKNILMSEVMENINWQNSDLATRDNIILNNNSSHSLSLKKRSLGSKIYSRSYRYKLASRGLPSLGLSTERIFSWPVYNSRIISSPFGYRGVKFHSGIDIQGKIGTPITAAKSGKIIFSGFKGDYGNCVIIDHGDGFRTLYGHASKVYVKEGEFAKAGETIAKIGISGNATGPHLHFEIRINDKAVNPENYL